MGNKASNDSNNKNNNSLTKEKPANIHESNQNESNEPSQNTDQSNEVTDKNENKYLTTYIQVKEALQLHATFNNKFEDIINNILSFISAKGFYVHNRCKYNQKTNKFEISFQNANGDIYFIENFMNIKLEEIIFKKNHQIQSKLDVYSFPIFVTNSGYLFITEVPFLEKAFQTSKHAYQQIKNKGATMFINSSNDSSYPDAIRCILCSKITQNATNGKIYIDSPFKIYSKQSDYEWRKNYLISNIWGLVHINIGNYKSKTSIVTIKLTKEMYQQNIVNKLLSDDKRKFKFPLDIKMDYGGVQCFTKIFAKNDLSECGILNAATKVDMRNVECMVVLNQYKFQFYELPNGLLIWEYDMNNLADTYRILAYNINVKEKYLVLIVQKKKGWCRRFPINSLCVMYYDIEIECVIKTKYLKNKSEAEIAKEKAGVGNAVYLPDVEYWKCQQVVDVDYGYNSLLGCFVWNLYIEYGDGASEPGRFEMKITLECEDLKELDRICGPRIRNYACSDYKESDGDVDWIYQPWEMNSLYPILVSSE